MADQLREFLSQVQVLVLDQDQAAQAGVVELLVQFGALRQNLHLAETLAEARDIVKARKPNLIFSEYSVKNESSLLLKQEQIDLYPENASVVFVLVTTNTAQSAVAHAAEEAVDGYILKPYTAEVFEMLLRQAVAAKLSPPEYMVLIERGRRLFAAGNSDGALSLFQEAMQKDTKPALACYYQGVVFKALQKHDQAQFSFQKGLTFCKIHFKCLNGLFDLLIGKNDFSEAYKILGRIVRYFPADPSRIGQLVDLAIRSGGFDQVLPIFVDYGEMARKSQPLNQIFSAAFIVCVRHFFSRNDASSAYEVLKSGMGILIEDARFSANLAQVLIESGQEKSEEGARLLHVLRQRHTGSEEFKGLVLGEGRAAK